MIASPKPVKFRLLAIVTPSNVPENPVVVLATFEIPNLPVPDVRIVPPRMIPSTASIQDPRCEVISRVSSVLSKVPTMLTFAPLLAMNVPMSAVRNVPPRLAVHVPTLMVPSLRQLPNRWSLSRPVTVKVAPAALVKVPAIFVSVENP